MTSPTLPLLIAAGVKEQQAQQFLEHLKATCAFFSIDTPRRLSMFLAQAIHESLYFEKTQENLFYKDPAWLMKVFPSRVTSLDQAKTLVRNPQLLANTVYADRLGNGDAASNDGWKFRGRGLFQLTGRANYTKAQIELNMPYVAMPHLVAEPSDACHTAAWFWTSKGCNVLADGEHFIEITRRINGPAFLGLDHRTKLWKQLASLVG